MITSIAGLLAEFQSKQVEILKAQSIVHAPTIGDMYEGLTRATLARAIPASLNLRIVNGFAKGHDGKLSKEVDAMLVMGNKGEAIPQTSKFTWPIQDVLAVFEVKKNLFGNELADSLTKMRTISRLHRDFMRANPPYDANLAPSAKAFARLMGRFPAQQEVEDLQSISGERIRTIAAEQLAPVRIIWGYEGYADEAGLRNALLDQLEKSMGADGLVPPVLPSLVICRRNSILKLTGHPYIVPLDNDWWILSASDRESPIRLLIELIWTRLSNQFDTAFPMDDTLDLERLAPLLSTRPELVDGILGWRYKASSLSRTQLTDTPGQEWTPTEVDDNEAVVVQMACLKGGLSIDNKAFIAHAKREGFNPASVVESLVSKRIFAWTSETFARPIADKIQVSVTPDEKFWASDNADLLALWVREYRKAPQPGSSSKYVGKSD